MSISSISFILITILITFLFVRRLESKSGCITFGYIGLVIFCINIFFIFSWGFFNSATVETYKVITSGKNYTATVIDYKTDKIYNSGSEEYEKRDTPTVRFLTDIEKTIQGQLDFSTSNVEIGDTYRINYNSKDGSIITLGFPFVIKIIAAFIFCFIFTFLFIGEILFVLNRQMGGYIIFIKKVGFYFFLPFLMIGFDALLVYTLFYGNDIPLYATAFLLFFILVLTLAIYVYFKMIFTEGISALE